MPTICAHARLVNQPELYQRLLDIYPSPRERPRVLPGHDRRDDRRDVYEAIDRYAKQDAIAYVHFRNVRGKVPSTTRSSSTRATST